MQQCHYFCKETKHTCFYTQFGKILKNILLQSFFLFLTFSKYFFYFESLAIFEFEQFSDQFCGIIHAMSGYFPISIFKWKQVSLLLDATLAEVDIKPVPKCKAKLLPLTHDNSKIIKLKSIHHHLRNQICYKNSINKLQ